MRAEQISFEGEFFRAFSDKTDIQKEIRDIKDQIKMFFINGGFHYMDVLKEQYYNYLSMEFFYDISRSIKINIFEELKIRLLGYNEYLIKLSKIRDDYPFHVIISLRLDLEVLENRKVVKGVKLYVNLRPALYYKILQLGRAPSINEEMLSFLIEESSTFMKTFASALHLEVIKEPKIKYDWPSTYILKDKLSRIKLTNTINILEEYLKRKFKYDVAAAYELRKLMENFFYELTSITGVSPSGVENIESNISKVCKIYHLPDHLKGLSQSTLMHIYKKLSSVVHKNDHNYNKSKSTILQMCDLYYEVFETIMLDILNYVSLKEVLKNENKERDKTN